VKLLVTGASGFLGRRVVDALLAAGHGVRALVRPSARLDPLAWSGRVDVLRADLRSHASLEQAFDGTDALIHLAAAMRGSDFARFAETVVGTERLFAAMARTPVKRLVLCSSFSVYDWLAARGRVDEGLALSSNPYGSGGYAAAKLWQERLATRMSEAHAWQLTIVRPGFIWGPGNELPAAGIGPSVDGAHLVFGPSRHLPLVHVENCAALLRSVVESPRAVGEVFNAVDEEPVTAWRMMGEHLRRTGSGGFRLPLPCWLVRLAIASVAFVARAILGPRAQLPTLFVPARFAQRFKPLRYDTEKLQSVLDWHPPLDFETCLRRTYSGAEHAGR
jgi:UDP-glucose 4-epimerase